MPGMSLDPNYFSAGAWYGRNAPETVLTDVALLYIYCLVLEGQRDTQDTGLEE